MPDSIPRPEEAKQELEILKAYTATFKGLGKTVDGPQRLVLDDIRRHSHIDRLTIGQEGFSLAKIAGRIEMFNWLMGRIDYSQQRKNELQLIADQETENE